MSLKVAGGPWVFESRGYQYGKIGACPLLSSASKVVQMQSINKLQRNGRIKKNKKEEEEE